MTSAVDICNAALAHLGYGTSITALNQSASVEAGVCVRHYQRIVNIVLRTYNWPFARAFATLTLHSDGTDEAWENEWDFAYRLPTDCLKLRRFVDGLGEANPLPTEFIISHGTYGAPVATSVRLVLCDLEEEDAVIEYTKAFTADAAGTTDVPEFSADFAEAVSWRLAAEIAAPLIGLPAAEPVVKSALSMYGLTLNEAIANYAHEQEPRDEYGGDFVAPFEA